MIYVSAAYAAADESLVTGVDSLGNTETVPASFTIFRQPEHGPIGFLNRGGTIAPYVAPSAPTSFRLFKSTIIRRLDDQEAAVLAGVLNAAPVKSKMLWDASEWIGSDDPLFGDLSAAIAEALGEARAAAILAPEA